MRSVCVIRVWSGLPVLLLFAGALLSACSPALNWREVHPGNSEAQILFPCKPTLEIRKLLLGEVTLSMSMYACQADGATYALAFADTGSQEKISAILEAWSLAQAKNLNAVAQPLTPTPVHEGRQSRQVDHQLLNGRLPDGTSVQQEMIFFATRTLVVRAMVMAPRVDREAASVFFESLHWPD